MLRGRCGRNTHSRLRFFLCLHLTALADQLRIHSGFLLLRCARAAFGGGEGVSLVWHLVFLSLVSLGLFGLFSVCLQSHFGNLSIYVRLLHGHARVAGVLF